MTDCVFPEEIMLCILTRLPVKSIVRFKSVCKPWRELFSTQEFMKMHQDQFSSDPKNHSVIIQSRKPRDDGGAISLWNIGPDEKKPSILDHPHPETYYVCLLGCCNGIVCIGRHEIGHVYTVLWNPAMNLFKFVKHPGNMDYVVEYDGYMVISGFGYDAEGDDFKLVTIACFKNESNDDGVWVDVYSVNSDSWTEIQPGFSFNIVHYDIIALVNGNPYWHATVDESEKNKSRHIGDVLLWLDVRKLVFNTVPLVSHEFHVGEMASAFMDWKGSLGVLSYNYVTEEMIDYRDVWVFDDCEQIWRKDHTFGPIEAELGRVLQCSKNGKMLYLRNNKMCVYDLESGWVKVFDAQPPPTENFSCLHVESLTYIKGMRPVVVKGEDYPWQGPLRNVEDVSEV